MPSGEVDQVVDRPGVDDRVGVEQQEVLAFRAGRRAVHARGEADVLLQRDELHLWELRADHLDGAVRRGVVGDDDLGGGGAGRLGDRPETVARLVPALVCDDQDRDVGAQRQDSCAADTLGTASGSSGRSASTA